MKTKTDKKVNRIIKNINRQVARDVFGSRFYIHQLSKTRIEGISYYLYEFIDRENPNATKTRLFNEFELLTFNDAWIEMNDLIIKSDFWTKYKQKIAE